MKAAEYDGYAPIHRCHCGAVVGDGDWASGLRACVAHRRRRRR